MDSISDFLPEAVIIDAGSFPQSEQALCWLDGCERIVCCDGAANEYLSEPRRVWRIIGDGDSLSQETARKYAPIIRRFPDQETNDQTKAVRYLAAKGVRRIVILGATGRREDHTLGNLALLVDYLRAGIDARAYTDYGVFIPVSGNREFECQVGTQVSIFNFGATGLRSEGLRYPIRDFDSWWQGTLNEAISERFTVYADGYYLVFINFLQKANRRSDGDVVR